MSMYKSTVCYNIRPVLSKNCTVLWLLAVMKDKTEGLTSVSSEIMQECCLSLMINGSTKPERQGFPTSAITQLKPYGNLYAVRIITFSFIDI